MQAQAYDMVSLSKPGATAVIRSTPERVIERLSVRLVTARHGGPTRLFSEAVGPTSGRPTPEQLLSQRGFHLESANCTSA